MNIQNLLNNEEIVHSKRPLNVEVISYKEPLSHMDLLLLNQKTLMPFSFCDLLNNSEMVFDPVEVFTNDSINFLNFYYQIKSTPFGIDKELHNKNGNLSEYLLPPGNDIKIMSMPTLASFNSSTWTLSSISTAHNTENVQNESIIKSSDSEESTEGENRSQCTIKSCNKALTGK